MAPDARFRAVARSGILAELPTLTTVKVLWQLLLLREDEEMTPGRLADLCGVDNQNLNRASQYLTTVGLVAREPRSALWRLADLADETTVKLAVLRIREAAQFAKDAGVSLGTHAGLVKLAEWADRTTIRRL